jgi:hypothetical protein
MRAKNWKEERRVIGAHVKRAFCFLSLRSATPLIWPLDPRRPTRFCHRWPSPRGLPALGNGYRETPMRNLRWHKSFEHREDFARLSRVGKLYPDCHQKISRKTFAISRKCPLRLRRGSLPIVRPLSASGSVGDGITYGFMIGGRVDDLCIFSPAIFVRLHPARPADVSPN